MGLIPQKLEKEYYERKTKRKQINYRNELAKNLKNKRKEGDSWKELAKTLLEEEQWKYEYFSSLWKGKASIKDAENFIENWKWGDDKRYRAYSVSNNIDKFQWKDQVRLVEMLLKYVGARIIAKNIDKIQDEYQLEVAEKIIEKDPESMADHIDKIQEKYQKDVSEKLKEVWYENL